MPRALVIVPTHDHAPLLAHSVGSVLRQTMTDLRVVVIGDGAGTATRDAVERMMATDGRVDARWFPKGARLGETWRNRVVDEYDSDHVLYLSDDDLWAPNHAATMCEALDAVDVVHSDHLFVDGDGKLQAAAVDLSYPSTRAAHQRGVSFICLSTIGHSRASAVDRGLRWQTTPAGRHTDWYFLTLAMCRSLAIGRTASCTVLNVPGSERRGWSIDQRAAELAALSDDVAVRWPDMVGRASSDVRAWLHASMLEQSAVIERLQRDLDARRRECAELSAWQRFTEAALEEVHLVKGQEITEAREEAHRWWLEATRAQAEAEAYRVALQSQRAPRPRRWGRDG